jgi:hypothetical protein
MKQSKKLGSYNYYFGGYVMENRVKDRSLYWFIGTGVVIGGLAIMLS